MKISIETKALVDLFDYVYQQGYNQACELLQGLKSSAGLPEDMKQEFINMLEKKSEQK